MRARRLIVVACLASSLLFAASTRAQTFSETTQVVLVEVPVHVIRDGKPVRGLTTDDFELFDGKRPQKIVGFEIVDLLASAAPEDARPAAPAGRIPITARRHFLLLFDLSFSQPDSIIKAREAALQLVEGALHPSDLVAVATYTQTAGARLLLGFTSDRRQARRAVATLGLPQFAARAQDPLGLVFGDLESSAADAFGRGRGAAAFAAAMLDFTRRMEAQQQRQEAQKISDLTRSLSDLARLLDSAGGRKHVVFLSEGFDTTAVFGTADRERQQQMGTAIESGEVWRVDSEERYGDTRSQNLLEGMFEAFVRADATIDTVDIGGIQGTADAGSGSRRAAERTRNRLVARQDSLAVMASGTGGDFLRHFNHFGEAMEKVLERTAVTYLLAFEPREIKPDGAFHRLRVKLKNPRGARLVHRPGYYAPRPFEDLSDEERRLRDAGLLVGGRDGGWFAADLLASPFPGTGAEAYVPFFFELEGKGLLAATWEDVLLADLFAYAVDSRGEVQDFLTQALSIDLGQARPALERGGLKYYGHFDLPPGAYRLRVLLRGRRNGLHALRHFELEVPDFDAHEPVLLPPFFAEAPGRWLMAQETLDDGEARPEFPFMMGGQAFLPAARPRLQPGESTVVNLMGYHLGAGRLDVEARLLRASGEEAGKGVLKALVQVDSDDPGSARLRGTLEPGSVEPGDYLLWVSVSDPGSGHEASSSAPVTIEGPG